VDLVDPFVEWLTVVIDRLDDWRDGRSGLFADDTAPTGPGSDSTSVPALGTVPPDLQGFF
jgi:hypothetical protein